MALGLALQDARARSRRAALKAFKVFCISHQPLRVARARRLLILVVLVCVTFYMCGVSGKVCVDQNGKKNGMSSSSIS